MHPLCGLAKASLACAHVQLITRARSCFAQITTHHHCLTEGEAEVKQRVLLPEIRRVKKLRKETN